MRRPRSPVAAPVAALTALLAMLALAQAAFALVARGSAHRGAQGQTNQTATVTGASGHVQVLRLREPVNGRVHEVWVYRPHVPDSAALPVLYFLHGDPGRASDPFTVGLARSLDRYIAAGGTPFVVASPDGNGSRDDTEWGNSTDGSQHLESFVTDVVIPAVEGSHPRVKRTRAIAGFSMGGFGAANIALRHPGLFGQVVSIAGYFHVDDPDHVFGSRSAIAANSPDHHIGAARTLRFLLLDAQNEAEPVIHGEALRFHRLLTAAGIPATLRIGAGSHDWNYVASQFGTIERFLATDWPAAPAAR